MIDFAPSRENQKSMWDLMENLFPRYRSLCGPGFAESLAVLQKWLDLDVTEYPSNAKMGEWTIPNEFSVNEAWVEDETGKRHLDYQDHPYHLWIYSQPFEGMLSKEALMEKVMTLTDLPHAIPLRQTYYRDDWGFCGSVDEISRMPDGPYKVKVDTVLKAGSLRIGEFYLPGESEQEILIDSYLCHPRGANDNLSGVVVAIELFRLLAKLPRRRYSYRLAIWPETIGPITWLNSHPEKLKNLIGGFEVSICGDSSPLTYNRSILANGITDRAVDHAVKHAGIDIEMKKYLGFFAGSNQSQFSMPGIKLPYGRITRTGPDFPQFKEYHSSADNLDVVHPEHLLESLLMLWKIIEVLDRIEVWEPTYVGTPFLSGHGVFPYQHNAGQGQREASAMAQTYYELMTLVNGEIDLLEIAENCDLPIVMFDEAVDKLSEVGLIKRKGR